MYKSTPILKYFNTLNISKKLRFIGLSTTMLAGLMSILVILGYQYYKEKVIVENNVRTMANIIADNISPAIAFLDTTNIELTLSSLKKNKIVQEAYALDEKWNILGKYVRSQKLQAHQELLFLKKDESLWKGNDFYLRVPIGYEQEHLGNIIVRASIVDFFSNIVKETFILIGIVIAAMALSNSYSNILIKSMLKPLANLNENTNNIIKTQDLSQSVKVYNKDEIGELATNFNTMLSFLNTSRIELEQYQSKLEDMVHIRTKELNQKTEELESLNQDLDKRINEAVQKNTQQEQMLIQQSRSAAMGEMIGNIAHQWRQPLNALNLLMQNIYFAFETGELELEELERMTAKGDRLMASMSKTIDDFRDFFKPNKDKRVFYISEGIKKSLDLISINYKSHNIELEVELEESLKVLGYENEFSQVILNILANAKDIIGEKGIENGRVKVKSYSKDNKSFIEIQDNAGGVPEDILLKVFDPYFTTKHKDEGTGIGLYMSKTIIEKNMSGVLSVSNKEGGASFLIELEAYKEEKV